MVSSDRMLRKLYFTKRFLKTFTRELRYWPWLNLYCHGRDYVNDGNVWQGFRDERKLLVGMMGLENLLKITGQCWQNSFFLNGAYDETYVAPNILYFISFTFGPVLEKLQLTRNFCDST